MQRSMIVTLKLPAPPILTEVLIANVLRDSSAVAHGVHHGRSALWVQHMRLVGQRHVLTDNALLSQFALLVSARRENHSVLSRPPT
jgi:hypothetical protein